MEKFRQQYRISSARLYGWDYGRNGVYFITICTHLKKCSLGQIRNSEIFLSLIGHIVLEEWQQSFTLRPELSCDIMTIMPNHLHAVVVVDKCQSTVAQRINDLKQKANNVGVAYREPKSLSSFVSGFKAAVTRKARASHLDFAWQSRFYDHIIRNETSYREIFEYIARNPANWEQDKLYMIENCIKI